MRANKEAALKGEIISGMLTKGSKPPDLLAQSVGESWWPWSAPETPAGPERTNPFLYGAPFAQAGRHGGWVWTPPAEPVRGADDAAEGMTEALAPEAARLRGEAVLPEGAAKEPNDKQVRYLRDNPDSWQVFDSMFGPGTAARVILGDARRQPTKLSRTASASPFPAAD
jgi:hypothetical protein